VVMNKNTLIMGDYKLIKGKSTKYAIWQSAVFPNASTPSQQVLEETYLRCDGKKNWGCLFNVVDDPTEHNEISELHPEIVSAMVEKLTAERQMFWSSKYDGNDACPDWIYEDEISGNLVIGDDASDSSNVCGCWMARNNYNGFAGPYQDLEEHQKLWKDAFGEEELDVVKGKMFGFIVDNRLNILIYAALMITTIVLLYVVLWNCKRKEDVIDEGVNKLKKAQGKRRRKKRNVSNYGTATLV